MIIVLLFLSYRVGAQFGFTQLSVEIKIPNRLVGLGKYILSSTVLLFVVSC